MAALRRTRLRHDLASRIATLPGSVELNASRFDAAAERYLEQALQQGFTLEGGAATVALLCARFGVGFLQDAQHPQMAALYRADIRADEGWRVALLAQWTDWHGKRQVQASPAATLARLRQLAALIGAHGVAVLTHDPAQVFAAIDPAKAALLDAVHWSRVSGQWKSHFAQTSAHSAQFQIDYASAVAFCCGQYFTYDPLWSSLSDLNPGTLNSFLKRSVSYAG